MFITHRWCWFQVTWASDSDITVRMKKMKASVRDLYIHGQLRVQLKPLIQTLPFVGGLQVCKIKFHGPFLSTLCSADVLPKQSKHRLCSWRTRKRHGFAWDQFYFEVQINCYRVYFCEDTILCIMMRYFLTPGKLLLSRLRGSLFSLTRYLSPSLTGFH